MDFKPCRATFQTEKERLMIYQQQHRGIKFKKFYLFPTIDREVNLVGQDDHIYRGRIPRISEDQLPPEVDASSLDEEKLYKEIKNIDFPPVPEQEPLGPTRRIEGEYTLQKRMILAPIKVELDEALEDYQILGRDGGIYRGKGRLSSQLELDKQLRGTKRSVYKKRQQSKSAGVIEPSLVTLQGINQVAAGTAIEVKIPVSNLRELTAIIKKQSKEADKQNSKKDKTEETGEPENLEGDRRSEATKPQVIETSNEDDDKTDNLDEKKAEETEDADKTSATPKTAEQDDSDEAEEASNDDESQENEESDDEVDAEESENEETDDTADADESPENEDTADSPEDEEQEDTNEEKETPEQESSDDDN